MAIKTGRHDDDLDENHEINVTPFIDVMLVLLIVFMVAAPLATVDVPVELPASAASPQPKDRDPIYLTVREDLSLSLNHDAVGAEELGARLDALTGGDRDERIFLRADKAVPYGELMGTMDALRKAGYLKVALVGLEQAPEPAG
ncbi:TonB system transport protein ExbD [Xanthomonas sp. AmX2]|uniref:TonB system transport protein ExbD n=1 Tax=Xanthomonas sp. TaxID=29446 RepID=UPI00197F1AC9|nr:TonB system transport protein ExbD [Xanthomonas sp.]MBN6150239.1 TonB system transport protein ExbD [Xanthomonas sp.]